MSNLEVVSPITVDGIEFYVSADGKHCGVSQVGLARLCGVAETTMRRTLTNLKGSGVRRSDASELVKDLKGKELSLAISSNQQANVIESKVAARIIQYFAFESSKATDIAKYSLGKFATIGIDTWIKEVTGFAESNDIAGMFKSISSQLNLMASEITEMKVQLIQTEGYRAARVELGGLRQWLEGVEQKELKEAEKESLLESEAEPLYTLNEWANMAQDGLVLSRSNKHALANLVSSTYKAMKLEMPPKKQLRNDKGHKLPPVQAYPEKHFTLINMCYANLVASR
jgi:hypothetical protein